ncbi:MAG: hypothetical protein Q9220_001912 [cf. Caloplaca sp. 1 TL-2023]
MSAFKENQLVRPHSQHRLSASSNPTSNLPMRQQSSRHHSHSVSLGTLNPTHRVTRRKSMTSTNANTAAIAAALSGTGQLGSQSNRLSLATRTGGSERPSQTFGVHGDILGGDGSQPNWSNNDTALADDDADDDDMMQDGDAVTTGTATGRPNNGILKARVRRASEGAHLSKGEGRRPSGELRCEKCGKGYKHSSCLTKHLWEHTPEWSLTSKLLISKHQQVQLLEAASVLVGMNQDGSDPPDSAKMTESDHSSASPDISATSELQDEYISSAETTPPPINDPASFHDTFGTARTKRYSGTSSVFSRSYQSAPSSSFFGGSVPSSSYGQQHSSQRRPSTSGVSSAGQPLTDEDEAVLAAAVQSLCSFGTSRTGPVHLPPDVPPVPPLPAQYAGQHTNRLSSDIMTPTMYDYGLSTITSQRMSNERYSSNIRSSKAYHTEADEVDQTPIQTNRNDDDGYGVFGRMDD